MSVQVAYASADCDTSGAKTLTTSMKRRESQFCYAGQSNLSARQGSPIFHFLTMYRVMQSLLVAMALATLPVLARSQEQLLPGEPSGSAVVTASRPLDSGYARPTQSTKIKNYIFDAYGPYPIAGTAFTAGINQLSNAPPEWKQGVEGYSKRVGSNFGIATVSTSTRYGLSEAFKEDALYYRCECRGPFLRISHAVISTFTARRGEDGHRVFSLPALVAPYVGSMTAIYGWYPSRYGAKDAFRTGNYNLLTYVGGNLALEFFYSGPHSLLSRMHLNNAHGSPIEGPNK
jgi:hypothetical protein